MNLHVIIQKAITIHQTRQTQYVNSIVDYILLNNALQFRLFFLCFKKGGGRKISSEKKLW